MLQSIMSLGIFSSFGLGAKILVCCWYISAWEVWMIKFAFLTVEIEIQEAYVSHTVSFKIYSF